MVAAEMSVLEGQADMVQAPADVAFGPTPDSRTRPWCYPASFMVGMLRFGMPNQMESAAMKCLRSRCQMRIGFAPFLLCWDNYRGKTTQRDFRCWHLADMPKQPDDVRSSGQSRHPTVRPRLQILTPLSGHGSATQITRLPPSDPPTTSFVLLVHRARERSWRLRCQPTTTSLIWMTGDWSV